MTETSTQAQMADDNTLESLRRHSVIVADTGDVEAMQQFGPTDATTNPSLILAQVEQGRYPALVDTARKVHSGAGGATLADHVIVRFGLEILAHIPGRVSTEVDARLSFDTEGSIRKGRELMALYRAEGIDGDRVLIKIASTWEGLQAARVLESEGIHCNLTLMFSSAQAAVAAEAGATLISPFVGRILDWYKKAEGVEAYAADDDPGVRSVRAIYHYLKGRGSSTSVMAASFRNPEQILALAGCDLLTISPALLETLQGRGDSVDAAVDKVQDADRLDQIATDEAAFRWAMNQNAMATDLLADGIRRFAADQEKLEGLLR